jgi:organic radical activating enzyme
MVKQIIPADHYLTRKTFQKDGNNFLNISEFYYDTIQGEGINAGVPAAFLRLQGCHLGCSYCDSTEVWRYGSPWTFNEIFREIEKTDLPDHLRNGQHLVITGGSPLLQQDRLIEFLYAFKREYGISSVMEIENDCTIEPERCLMILVDIWNNSPKLSSSGVPLQKRYKPDVIKSVASYPDSWFKFVISSENDWAEISEDFLDLNLIKKEQIILMPEGATREELQKNREMVIDMTVKHGVRYSDRLHIIAWDKKVGV